MKKSLPILLLLSGLLPTAAQAQNELPADTLKIGISTDNQGKRSIIGFQAAHQAYGMDRVVVTSTRTPRPMSESPVITRVITSEDIETSGATTIEKVLERELAGVEFHQAGYGTTVSFQGLDARYVLFLVDGERLAGETYGNIDYSRIPLSNVDRIEIVRGASSVLYGSNAMGAVVNIITRMPEDKVEVSGSVRMGTKYQSNKGETLADGASDSDLKRYRDKLDKDNIAADVNLGFNLGKFRSATSVGYRSSDAYKVVGRRNEKRTYDKLSIMTPKMPVTSFPPEFVVKEVVQDTTIYTEPDSRGLGVSGYVNYNINQKFDYTLNEKFRFELSGSYSDRKRYDFFNSIMDDNPMSAYFPGSGEWGYEEYEGYNGKFLMEHTPNQFHKVYLSMVRDEYRRDSHQAGVKRHKQRHIYNTPRLLWTWNPNDMHMLTTGAEFTNEILQFDLNPAGYGKKTELNTASVYVQDEINRGGDLSVVAGLRGDWNNQFGWRATPQVSAKYNIDDHFTIRQGLSFGYRNPSLKEMYMTLDLPIANSPKIVGNPDLKAETNIYVSTSLTYAQGRVYAAASFGQSFFRNKIDARWESDAAGNSFLHYTNIKKNTTGNVELMAKVNVAKGLYISGNYNYTFQYDDAEEESSTQYIYPSPHTLTANIDYSFGVGKKAVVNLNANARYVSGKDYEDMMPYVSIPDDAMALINKLMNGQPVLPSEYAAMRNIKYFTGNYTSHQKGYAVFNASAGVDFDNIYVTVGAENIFDYRPKVVSFNSAITPRANGYIKVGFRFRHKNPSHPLYL